VFWIAVLLQSKPEVVAVIDTHSFCNGVLYQLYLVAQVDLLEAITLGRGLDLDLFEEDSQG